MRRTSNRAARAWVERLEPRRLLAGINDYVLAFASGINLIDTGENDERGGIFVMRPDGSQLRQITSFTTNNYEFSGHGLNLPDDHPSFSPDGRTIVFASSRHDTGGVLVEDNFELYTMDPNGANVKRLTFNTALDTEPAFSPDGTKIAFSSTRAGEHDIWVMNADGSNPVRLTDFGSDGEVEPAWSPDGTKIAFTRVTFTGIGGVLGTQKDIWVMDANGANKRQLTNLRGEEHDASWSPDGTRLAVTSERGQLLPKPPYGDTVIIRASDGAELSVVTDGFLLSAGDPAWSPDGSKIAVFKADLPVLTGPLVIYTLNPDGSGERRLQAPGIISVHPAWGLAADSDNDGTPNYLENANTTFDADAAAGSREAGALLGAASALPDLNHDGFPDLVSSAPLDHVLGVADAGRIVILRGSPTGPDFSYSLIPPVPPALHAGFFGQLQAGGHFGQALAAGDFNGDGFKDLAIGAPGQNRVFILLGATGPSQQLTAAGGEFGFAMTVGDFNNDGRDDLAIGSPSELRAISITQSLAAGAVRIYFGSAGGLSPSPQLIDQGSLPLTDAGREEAGDRFGHALAAGDLNGDFIDDLAIGVPGEDITGVANAGMVHVLPGRSASTLNIAAGLARDGRNLPSPHTGLQAAANFGEVLAMGDFNGDIFDIHDLVVGVPRQDVSGTADAGIVASFGGVLSASASFAIAATAQAFTTASVGGPSPTASLRFGQTLVTADFTGDAVDDLAAAAPNQSFGTVARAGVIYLVPGAKNSTTLSQFQIDIGSPFGAGGGLALASAQQISAAMLNSTAAVDDRLGASLPLPSANTLAAGDIDQDGQADLVIGTPERNFGALVNAGQVGIRYGIKVGASQVTPSAAALPRDGRVTYSLQWTHPDRWRELDRIELRLVGDGGVVAWLRFDEASNTIALADPRTGQFTHTGQPGQKKKLKAGDVELDLRNTLVVGAGDDEPSVALTLALKLKLPPLHKGSPPVDLRVEVFTSDDNGNSQGFEQAATLRIVSDNGGAPRPPRVATASWLRAQAAALPPAALKSRDDASVVSELLADL